MCLKSLGEMINSIEQSLFWESEICPPGQEISHLV
jgi:hypothetical protein